MDHLPWVLLMNNVTPNKKTKTAELTNMTHEANDGTNVTTEFDAAGTPPDIERNTPSPRSDNHGKRNASPAPDDRYS
jgi:hypothetical protein